MFLFPLRYPEDAPLYFETLPEDLDTGTITEDEAFIQYKTTLLISQRSFEFALNTAIKAAEEVSQYFIDLDHQNKQLCEREKLQKEMAKDYIELLWYTCFLQPEISNKVCFTQVVARDAAENARTPLIKLPLCDVAPAATYRISKVAKSLAKISEWISRIA